MEKAPLLRAEVLKAGGDEHVLMLDMHHIISDGVSMAIFTRELAELYEGKTLPPLTIQYKDFSEWQKLFIKKLRLNARKITGSTFFKVKCRC
ncbi:condensation domain-containing protein [Bacillus licheniformis]